MLLFAEVLLCLQFVLCEVLLGGCTGLRMYWLEDIMVGGFAGLRTYWLEDVLVGGWCWLEDVLVWNFDVNNND